MNQDTKYAGLSVFIIVAVVLLIVIAIPSEPKCSMSSCDNDAKDGSGYCYLHDLSYRSYGNPDYNEVYENSKKNRNNNSSSSDYLGSNSTSNSTSTNRGTTSKKTYSSYDSYDEGYEDIYDNEDYDMYRYNNDSEYAAGVDDAMDDLDW